MSKATIQAMAERAFPDLPELQVMIGDVYDIAYQEALDDAAYKIAALTAMGDTAASFSIFVKNLRKPREDA